MAAKDHDEFLELIQTRFLSWDPIGPPPNKFRGLVPKMGGLFCSLSPGPQAQMHIQPKFEKLGENLFV